MISFLHRLYSFDANIDFKKGWRVAAVLSTIMVVVSLGFLVTRQLNLGIDFRGGIAWQFPANGASTSDIQDAVTSAGGKDPRVQKVGTNEFRVEIPPTPSGTTKAAYEGKISSSLASTTRQPVSVINQNLNEVGPTWGSDVSQKALKALVIFLVAIFVYVWIRLQWQFGVGAIVSVIHDVIVSVGVYSIFQFEVTPGTVIAFLTILGYSLYDTIVVYDKIRENERLVTPNGRITYTDMCNLSVNQTFMRSINTTLSAVLPVLSILVIGAWVLGAVTLEEFGLALLVGLLSGAYSSVFIAAPVTAWIREREPRYRAIHERLSRLSADERDTLPEPAVDDVSAVAEEGSGDKVAVRSGGPGDGRDTGRRDRAGERADGGDTAGSPSRRRGAVPPRPGSGDQGSRSGAAITPRPRKQTAARRKKK